MTVYLDLIFLLNFLIDWILLWSTAFVLKQRVRWYRLACGAMVGAGYTMVLFFPPLSGLFTFFAKFILSMVMIYGAFGYHRLYVFLQRLLLFYLVAFVMGGGLLGVNFYLQSESEILSGIAITQNGGFGTPVTWGFIALAFPILWWLSGKGLNHLKDNNRKASFYVEVAVWIGEKSVSCRGLMDTGNQLYEPFTRLPVTMMDVKLFQELLPSHLYTAIEEHADLSSTFSLMETDDPWLQRMRLIPYRSVSRGMDLLLAIKPDKIRIDSDGIRYETGRALIGLNPVPLSSDGNYQAIVHPRLTDADHLVSQESKTMEAM